MSALIVVDVQNDFLTGSLALKECPAKEDGEEVIEVINQLSGMSGWDMIVFTKDWHPLEHISFVTNAHRFKQHLDSVVQQEQAEVYDVVAFDVDGEKRDQMMWPPHCIQGTWGSELHADLVIPKDSHIVEKGVQVHADSYSAFFDNCKLHETELNSLLKSKGITKTFICGVATDVCVNYTVFDSLELGYETYMIEDACRGVNCENIKNVKNRMRDEGVHCVTSEQIPSLLAGTKLENNTYITKL